MCFFFIKGNNDYNWIQKKYLGIMQGFIVRKYHIDTCNVFLFNYYLKWKISILFIYKMRIYFEGPVFRSIMLFAIDFAKFWIYHSVCRTRIAAKIAILEYWYCMSFSSKLHKIKWKISNIHLWNWQLISLCIHAFV